MNSETIKAAQAALVVLAVANGELHLCSTCGARHRTFAQHLKWASKRAQRLGGERTIGGRIMRLHVDAVAREAA